MYDRPRITRNAPCPCGSGKKYKRCCGAVTAPSIEGNNEPDSFRMNMEIAYKGRIGRQRETFCVNYIENKQQRLQEVETTQIRETAALGETITCQKGCSFCCLMYVEASIQECEAIVYHLYHNETTLRVFLQEYPKWREELRTNGDLFKRFGQLWRETVTSGHRIETLQSWTEEERHYQSQNIPCPFLHNHLCSIYEVRPYMCAALIATTPSEWCSPSNPNEPKFYKAVPVEFMYDRSFYYGTLEQPAATFMPLVVYEILKAGTYYLSGIPGLEQLDDEALSDPQVKPILQRYL